MKNLEESVREKAIEIVNALLDEGYEEGRAIPIAISQAKEWGKHHSQDGDVYHVIPEDDKWIIKKENSEKVIDYYDTKDDAMNQVKELAKDHQMKFIIHDQDGKFQSTY